MQRTRAIPIGVLNIAMHSPHSPERYLALFHSLLGLKRAIHARGSTMIMLGKLHPLGEERERDLILAGEIYTYYNLDPGSPWFDIDRNEEALEEEVVRLSIPRNLKPDLSRFVFAFTPASHRMCVQLKSGTRSLSVNVIAKALRGLFSFQELEEYGPVEVTPEPSRETVEEILDMPFLHRLHIELLRPNPDDDHEFELAFLDRLESQSASKMSQDLISEKERGLRPDEATRSLARLASSNGLVEGQGKDINNASIRISTRDTPLIEKQAYDPRESSLVDFMVLQARRINSFFTNSNGHE